MNNDLSIKEDIYSPSRSDDGTYVDKLPPNQKAFAGNTREVSCVHARAIIQRVEVNLKHIQDVTPIKCG